MPTDEDQVDDQFEPKVISPKLRRVLQQCYEHAMQLMSKEGYSHDYASKSLLQCVVGDPGNITYVSAFLDNLQAKYKNNKKGGSFSFGGGGDKRGFKKAVAAKDLHEVLKLGPPLLEKNPWDVQVLRPMADACEEFFYNEVELRYLKNALDANPKDIDVNRHCAMSLARMAQFDQAIVCWRRISEMKKGATEPLEMISKLTIDKTKAAGGIESTESLTPEQRERTKRFKKYKEAREAREAEEASGENAAAPAAGAARTEIARTPRQKLESEIQDFPGEVENYILLAELLLEENRFNDVERVLNKGLSVGGADLKIQERLEDCQMARAAHQVQIAEQQIGANKTEAGKQEAQRLADQLRRDQIRCELEIYENRSQRYPTDVELQYQVARRLKKIGNYAEAIKRLQEVANDREYTAQAAMNIGESYELLKQYPRAVKSYQKSVEACNEANSREKKLKAYSLYRAALLTMIAVKDYPAAEQMFTSLLELSPGYKDAAARLDKLKKMSDKT